MAHTTPPAEPLGAAGSPPPTASPNIAVSPISRARIRPLRAGRELLIWYLMRITGVALFVIALAHFSINHFIFDPAEQTAEWIIRERWSQAFWRVFAWLLLMTALFHSFLGMRIVTIDYVHRPRVRTAALWILYATAIFLFIIGTEVIVTLPSPGSD